MTTTEIASRKYVSPRGTGTETSVSKAPQDCKYFHNCSANLCPLDLEISKRIWLPEESDTEEICRNPEFAGLQFVITQKKIRRVLRNREKERDDFFTFEMLNRDITVKSGIRGIPLDPPDTVKDAFTWYRKKEKLWIARHPEKKELSAKEIQRRKVQMHALRGGIGDND